MLPRNRTTSDINRFCTADNVPIAKVIEQKVRKLDMNSVLYTGSRVAALRFVKQETLFNIYKMY
jgi:hypothetical protein